MRSSSAPARRAPRSREGWRAPGRKSPLSSGLASAAPASIPAAPPPKPWSPAPTPCTPARRGADYGFSAGGEVTVDMKRVKARKDHVVGLSNQRVERSLDDPREWPCLPRSCALRLAARGRGRRGDPARRTDLHQCRRPRRGGANCRPRRRRLSHQQLDDGPRCPAAASAGGGRQLHRPRVRADVSPLRQQGHDRRDGTAPGRARGRGCFGRRLRHSSPARASIFA